MLNRRTIYFCLRSTKSEKSNKQKRKSNRKEKLFDLKMLPNGNKFSIKTKSKNLSSTKKKRILKECLSIWLKELISRLMGRKRKSKSVTSAITHSIFQLKKILIKGPNLMNFLVLRQLMSIL